MPSFKELREQLQTQRSPAAPRPKKYYHRKKKTPHSPYQNLQCQPTVWIREQLADEQLPDDLRILLETQLQSRKKVRIDRLRTAFINATPDEPELIRQVTYLFGGFKRTERLYLLSAILEIEPIETAYALTREQAIWLRNAGYKGGEAIEDFQNHINQVAERMGFVRKSKKDERA